MEIKQEKIDTEIVNMDQIDGDTAHSEKRMTAVNFDDNSEKENYDPCGSIAADELPHEDDGPVEY